MSRKIIIMISEGRSGTNGVYRHLFANSISKTEPFKDIPTDKKSIFKKKLISSMSTFEKAKIIHIKPSHMWANRVCKTSKLEYNEFVDACIECGIKNFIVIRRNNILARLASDPKCDVNFKKQIEIKPNKLAGRLQKGHVFEDNITKYIKTKNANLVELVYEDHIKKDVNIACRLITETFTWLPLLYKNYTETKQDTRKLKSFEQNNNLLDKRPMHKRISNVDDIIPLLERYNAMWMLEK